MNIFGNEEEEPQANDTRIISNSLGIDLGTFKHGNCKTIWRQI